jgi:alkylation response protein AidB-like acyl-CoA dehydrogenase
MDLLPSDEQTQIVDTIKGVLADQAPIDRLREHGAIGNPDAALWPKLGELGFLGLSLTEAQGGVGLGATEEMLIFVEFGRYLISLGVFGLILGARVAALAGDQEQRDEFLSGAVAIGIANARGPVRIDDGSVTGEFHLFESASTPWVLLLSERGAGLFLRSDFKTIEEVHATDAVLSLERATLDGSRPRFWVSTEQDNIHSRALMLLGAYAVGIGEGARDMAVEYSKVREQFGRPIGSFQAIKHICADMAIRSEAALCQASFAALALANGLEDTDFHAVASKIVATETARRNAAANIQVHGAFGFTSEANAHHYLKRAHVADLLWGSLREQRERILTFPTPA